MGEGFNFRKLQSEIFPLSKAQEWEVTKKEWSLVSIYDADEPQTCLCGHHPIIEICEIRNRITRDYAEVGNVCVKRFFGIRSDLIFAAIKRVRKDLTKSLNAESIVFFHEKGLLDDWEYDFLQKNIRKRNLTLKQIERRKTINRKVLRAIQRRGFSAHSR